MKTADPPTAEDSKTTASWMKRQCMVNGALTQINTTQFKLTVSAFCIDLTLYSHSYFMRHI